MSNYSHNGLNNYQNESVSSFLAKSNEKYYILASTQYGRNRPKFYFSGEVWVPNSSTDKNS